MVSSPKLVILSLLSVLGFGLRAFAEQSATAQCPLFQILPEWEPVVTAQLAGGRDPADETLANLVAPWGKSFNPDQALATKLSPLAWAAGWPGNSISARQQAEETRRALQAIGIQSREIVPIALTAQSIADTMLAALAAGHPILVNVPGLGIIYGYDRREPDMWWLVRIGAQSELILESERHERLVLWSEDPSAGIFWIVTGAEEGRSVAQPTEKWELLSNLNASVQGDETTAVAPYPLTWRILREALADTTVTPELGAPVHPHDPAGLVRAAARRKQIAELVTTLAAESNDSTVSSALRLAAYQFHVSAGTIDEMAAVLYGANRGQDLEMVLTMNWGRPAQRSSSLGLLNDMLKAERQAMEAIDEALKARDRSGSQPRDRR